MRYQVADGEESCSLTALLNKWYWNKSIILRTPSWRLKGTLKMFVICFRSLDWPHDSCSIEKSVLYIDMTKAFHHAGYKALDGRLPRQTPHSIYSGRALIFLLLQPMLMHFLQRRLTKKEVLDDCTSLFCSSHSDREFRATVDVMLFPQLMEQSKDDS